MSKKSRGWDMSAITQAAKDLAVQDRSLASELAQVSNTRMNIPLDAIRNRPGQNTRELSLKHVVDLCESISAIGLIEPLVVDRNRRLLAGAHRLAALRLLAEGDPEARLLAFQRNWTDGNARRPANEETLCEQVRTLDPTVFATCFPGGQIPVHLLDLDAEQEASRALAIEVAENEHRRDYTPLEVRSLALRLRATGYHDTRGRPREGDRPLLPALSVIVGKSYSTIQRMLRDEAQELNRSNDRIKSEQALLNSLERALTAWVGHAGEDIPVGSARAELARILELQVSPLIKQAIIEAAK